MRILCILFSALLPFLAGPSGASSAPALAAQSQTLTYALLETSTVLYSDSAMSVPVTTLPKTYFVVLLEDGGTFYRVSYLDLNGYIDPAAAQVVDYEPVTKFASAFRFTVQNDGYPARLRRSPDHSGNNVINEIAGGYRGLYYGSLTGSTMLPEVGNLWYYVKYDAPSGTEYGYIYKSQIAVEPIEDNKIEKVEPPVIDNTPRSPFEFGDWSSVIIILCLSIPAALVMLLIFKKNPKRIPRHSREDYHDSPEAPTRRKKPKTPKEKPARKQPKA